MTYSATALSTRRLPGRRFTPFLALLVCLVAGCEPAPDDATRSDDDPAQSSAGDMQAEAGYVSLFDGETLAGWERHMGLPEDQVGGKWEVVDGAIEGDQDPPGHGGFLVTTEDYGDFELELETQLDYPVDSGIFLRVGEDGKSHQVTLDYREGGSIGSIYLPWTQGGVYSNPQGIEQFREGAWNDVRVRIEGEPARIRFWLNGALVTDFQHTEETTQGVPRRGTIGLQVHPGESYEAGKKVRFRNIRIMPLG